MWWYDNSDRWIWIISQSQTDELGLGIIFYGYIICCSFKYQKSKVIEWYCYAPSWQWGRFEAGLSRFPTGMVLKIPAHYAPMWQQNVMLLFLNILYY